MRTLRNRRGQGLIEYVLILVLMGVVAIGTLHRLGAKTHNALADTGDALQEEMSFGKSGASTSGRISGG